MYRKTLLTLTLISVTCGSNAWAQGIDKPVDKPTKFGNKEIFPPKLNKYETVEFPDLPEFTGKAKLILQHRNKVESGISTIQVKRVKESMQQVHDWYSSVLKMNKWVIIHDDPRTIIANRQGNSVNLQLNGGMELSSGMPTEVELIYFHQTLKRGANSQTTD